MQDKYKESINIIKNCPPHVMKVGKQETANVRDDRIDAVKFWLIVLVIAAHVFMRKEFADLPICAVVSNWILLFAMPLFIFISGYFSRKKDKKGFGLSIWKILEPLMYHRTSDSIRNRYRYLYE